MKKYEFTGQTKEHSGIVFNRIKRLKDGKLGGWIEKKENLSQHGNSWVYGDAEVYGDAKVYGNAEVYGNSRVCGNSRVFGDATIFGNSRVCGNSKVCGDAVVCGDVMICGNAIVCGNAKILTIDCYWNLVGFHWGVTYTKSNNSLTIGCQTATVKEWSKRDWHGENGEYDENLANILRNIFLSV